ncbi:carboxylate--amine ligase [Halobacteriales archaeon QS_5_70_15]|nr:MAG: carboxylate--amine ligase [Halobacteriales archaeon QS_5_70_15]
MVAIDRTGRGVAPSSAAVAYAGQVTYPLEDPDAFREDVESLAAEIGHEPVAFACMDEWVNAFAEERPDGVRLSFDPRTYDGVLDKESLYRRCEALGVPYPETHSLADIDPTEAADRLGYPLVAKPARKREGEAVLGTNVLEIEDEGELASVVATAEDAGIRLLLQERVDVAVGEDRSVASYVPASGVGDALGIVGNARVRDPTGYGTSCVVRPVESPELAGRAYDLLADAGYHGISEAEFVYDEARGEFVLLDLNTRPWKWIGLPVEVGADLPYAAYAGTLGDGAEAAAADRTGPAADATWVYLRDYLEVLATEPSFADVLDRETWTSLVSGRFEDEPGLTTGVYAPSDPGPAVRLLETEFGPTEYYCSC